MEPRGFLVMGVSGSGKTTLGQALALELGWDFFDADDFHSTENIVKMSAGIPLTDADRSPWLAALNRQLAASLEADRHPVLACSALKEGYRVRLLERIEGIHILYLQGSYETIRSRLLAREGHYMKETLLQSQFDTLQEPEDALVLDVSLPLQDQLGRVFIRYPCLRGN